MRTRELAEHGIHRQELSRLVAAGKLERESRGLYRTPASPLTEHHTLAIASAAVPRGVICLLSALRFHGIGTQIPSHAWIAIDRRARQPALDYPTLKVVQFTGADLTEGIRVHRVEGQTARVYGVAKALVDRFTYRNKIGLDVALEAHREAWRARRFTIEELNHYYRLSRSPYAERFVLKGALLMLVRLGEKLRPTIDADVLGFSELSEATLAVVVGEAASQAVETDPAEFDVDSVRVEPIRA